MSGDHCVLNSQCTKNFNACVNEFYTYEIVSEIANSLLAKCKHKPQIGIVCGSGLGKLTELVEEKVIIPYEDVKYFPTTTVKGHKGNLVFGKIHGKTVVCMEGRFHSYEGHAAALCALPIKVMKLLGVSLLICTAAAGSSKEDYKRGDIMIIKDHINFPGLASNSPLIGPNDERFGPRFPPLIDIYDEKLRDLIKQIAKDDKESFDELKEGVYTCISGPCFETVAETRFLSLINSDALGMSVVHETTVAFYCGMKVLGLALISDKAPDTYAAKHHTTHEEVLKVVDAASAKMLKLVEEFIRRVEI